jgi:hypothetical protein
MKRSFRVATVFTGATACAVALTPMAEAAPVAAGATARMTPNAVAGNCPTNANSTNALVLYYTTSEHHTLPACILGKGKVSFGKKRFRAYCAGQYSGYFWINGAKKGFTAGIHSLYGASVSAVSITKSPHPGSFCPISLP